jgi:hypothetical protein
VYEQSQQSDRDMSDEVSGSRTDPNDIGSRNSQSQDIGNSTIPQLC